MLHWSMIRLVPRPVRGRSQTTEQATIVGMQLDVCNVVATRTVCRRARRTLQEVVWGWFLGGDAARLGRRRLKHLEVLAEVLV
jgi:hypothetical protein